MAATRSIQVRITIRSGCAPHPDRDPDPIACDRIRSSVGVFTSPHLTWRIDRSSGTTFPIPNQVPIRTWVWVGIRTASRPHPDPNPDPGLGSGMGSDPIPTPTPIPGWGPDRVRDGVDPNPGSRVGVGPHPGPGPDPNPGSRVGVGMGSTPSRTPTRDRGWGRDGVGMLS